ncbi:MAG: hypothetical protein LBJ84_05240 [Oscillospiraceae bacterium]|nr:hypothetical protein [Oscillospiraceae bacterium]
MRKTVKFIAHMAFAIAVSLVVNAFAFAVPLGTTAYIVGEPRIFSNSQAGDIMAMSNDGELSEYVLNGTVLETVGELATRDSSSIVSASDKAKTAKLEKIYRQYDEILSRINAEYGTNIRRITKEEAYQKYGIELPDVDISALPTLEEYEGKLRKTAEEEIPLIAQLDMAAKEQAEFSEIEAEERDVTQNASESIMAVYVEASKPLTYAYAWLFAYADYNGSGGKIWTTIVDAASESNVYWANS